MKRYALWLLVAVLLGICMDGVYDIVSDWWRFL